MWNHADENCNVFSNRKRFDDEYDYDDHYDDDDVVLSEINKKVLNRIYQWYKTTPKIYTLF